MLSFFSELSQQLRIRMVSCTTDSTPNTHIHRTINRAERGRQGENQVTISIKFCYFCCCCCSLFCVHILLLFCLSKDKHTHSHTIYNVPLDQEICYIYFRYCITMACIHYIHSDIEMEWLIFRYMHNQLPLAFHSNGYKSLTVI